MILPEQHHQGLLIIIIQGLSSDLTQKWMLREEKSVYDDVVLFC